VSETYVPKEGEPPGPAQAAFNGLVPGRAYNIRYTVYCSVLYCTVLYCTLLSPKFKRVSLNETPEVPFWGLNIGVDFDLRDTKKRRIYE